MDPRLQYHFLVDLRLWIAGGRYWQEKYQRPAYGTEILLHMLTCRRFSVPIEYIWIPKHIISDFKFDNAAIEKMIETMPDERSTMNYRITFSREEWSQYDIEIQVSDNVVQVFNDALDIAQNTLHGSTYGFAVTDDCLFLALLKSQNNAVDMLNKLGYSTDEMFNYVSNTMVEKSGKIESSLYEIINEYRNGINLSDSSLHGRLNSQCIEKLVELLNNNTSVATGVFIHALHREKSSIIRKLIINVISRFKCLCVVYTLAEIYIYDTDNGLQSDAYSAIRTMVPMPSFLKQAIKSRDTEIRFRCVNILQLFTKDSIYDTLEQAMNDPDKAICDFAHYQMAFHPAVQNTRYDMLKALAYDPDSRYNWAALKSSVADKSGEGVSVWTDGLAHPDATVRMNMLIWGWFFQHKGLLARHIYRKSAIKALVDQDPRVRIHAALALELSGDTDALPAIEKCLSDQNDMARHYMQSAFQTLCHLNTGYRLPNNYTNRSSCLPSKTVMDAFANALRNADYEWMKIYVINNIHVYFSGSMILRMIARISNPVVLPALLEVFTTVIDRIERRIALEGLTISADERTLPILCDRICIARGHEYFLFIQALITVGKKRISALYPLFDDTRAQVRAAACTVMCEIGITACVPHLLRALKDSDSWVRGKAARALGKIGHGAARHALTDCLYDPQSGVRAAAAYALGMVGTPDDIWQLESCLQVELSSMVRRTLEFSIKRLKTKVSEQ